MRIRLDESRCQGTGMCEALAPDFFEVDDHGDLDVLMHDVANDRQDEVTEAVASCPTGALTLDGGPA